LIAIYLRGIKNESKRKQENKTSALLVKYRGESKKQDTERFPAQEENRKRSNQNGGQAKAKTNNRRDLLTKEDLKPAAL